MKHMMAEIREVHAAITPHETLFVVDAMTGQDAANTAAAFNDALPLTGIVLTKTDGDARGGAALSVRQITGKPVKFLGSGEKTDALQPFHPERVASRILGMGDVLSLVEEVHRKVDQQQAEKLVNKMRRGRGFDLEDFRSQLEQMQNMGGLGGLVDKLPGMSNLPDQVKSQVDDRQTRQMIAIINSMTPQERTFSGCDPRVAQETHREWFRHPDPGGQPAPEAAQPDAANDEENGQGRHVSHDAKNG